MGIKRMALNLASVITKRSLRLLGQDRCVQASAGLAEQITPIVAIPTDNGSIKFYCPGRVPLWRAKSMLTKDPDTIEWIDGFESDCVFWDIGANIGIYSLYAALKLNIKVLAFEPSAFNYYLLNRNIEINKMDEKILSLAIAFSDNTSFDSFYLKSTEVGGALHGFGEALDWDGKPFLPVFKQGMVGLSIDDFVEKFNPPFPNHIKIDVDGIENKIIVVLPIGSGENFKGKRWKDTNFARLADKLIEKHNLNIVYTGVQKERKLIENTILKMKHKALNLCGQFTLPELVEFLRCCYLFISNDTGPLHIAISLGINTVGLYGPMSPRQYGSLNHNSLSFYKPVGCNPCLTDLNYKTSLCKKSRCLEQITVQEVLEKISEKFFNQNK